MATANFRRGLLATTTMLLLAMTGAGFAPPDNPLTRPVGLIIGGAVVLSGLLIILSGLHLLHTSTRR